MSPPSRDELREQLAVVAEAARNASSRAAGRLREFVESRPGAGRLAAIWAVVVIVALALVGIALGRRGASEPDKGAQVAPPAVTSTTRAPERDTSPGTGAPPTPGAPPEPGPTTTSSARAPEGGGPPSPTDRTAPSTSSAPPQSAQPPSAQPPSRVPGEGAEHVVARGETLAAIAVRYDVPFEQIATDNGIADPNEIRAGQRLLIKAKPAGVVVIQPGRTLSDYARSSGRGLDELVRMNPQLTNPNRILAGGRLNV
ncbi:LysM peptidoglycan-binding domain-containing protein [Pseudonocardia acaciae]|uniref:LysM peptidoglycan-binding domain-containing protein n=1 Tax=Pseudonocardia acaciae TaxID=551276 RepID=UPI00048C0A43|nr:LysM peptidoglycan-binding domain-containing protein [Pseudonocardia acaciae]